MTTVQVIEKSEKTFSIGDAFINRESNLLYLLISLGGKKVSMLEVKTGKLSNTPIDVRNVAGVTEEDLNSFVIKERKFFDVYQQVSLAIKAQII